MSKTNTQNCEYWKIEIFQMVSMIQSETAIHRIYNHVVRMYGMSCFQEAEQAAQAAEKEAAA